MIVEEETAYTRRSRLETPSGGLSGTSPRTLLDPKGSATPRRRPGLPCVQRSEWKVGIDGRRTHLALGFERSSLTGGGAGSASRTGRMRPEPSRRGPKACLKVVARAVGAWSQIRCVQGIRRCVHGQSHDVYGSSNRHRRVGEGRLTRSIPAGISIIPENHFDGVTDSAPRDSVACVA